MITAKFTVDCHCGSEAVMTTTFLDAVPGEVLVIDAELALGQAEFACQTCGCVSVTGDLDVFCDEACDGSDDDEAEVQP